MQLSAPTLKLLNDVDGFSGSKLRRREDLGFLFELAHVSNAEDALADLSFQAKFLSRTFGILQRIGRGAEGADRLTGECERAIIAVREALRILVAGAPEGDRTQFSTRYLADSPEALQELLHLSYDLSWHKNWLLDHP
jgi:hypothetical protein